MLRLDPHIHSEYSHDSNSKISNILKVAKVKKLDAIAISDHNTVKGSIKAIDESSKYEKLLVIPSIEISSSKGHVLGLGVEELIDKGLSPEETIDKIHDQGGLAIIPHPYSFYRSGLFSKVIPPHLKIDAIEILNAKYFIGYGNKKARKFSKKYNIPGIGASDSHMLKTIGSCFTKVNSDMDIDSILKAIKKNKINTMGKGNSYISNAKNNLLDKISRK
ncbi:CehA/McbA family metallohydrolase [Methanobrevibacter sp. DSM 116169]|uniref:CehA/McbA family metallohydrolase n=1 Tax=Methanobrevibacter sp. DSM 116169 TaxID=3242727 RepID=UPI0038FC09A9